MNALTNQTSLTPVAQRTVFPVNEFAKLPEFDCFTDSIMRHLIFNSRPRYSASGDVIPGNGLVEAGAIIRVGRRVLIDAPRFREWLMSKRESISP